jgi:hypothetical protein
MVKEGARVGRSAGIIYLTWIGATMNEDHEDYCGSLINVDSAYDPIEVATDLMKTYNVRHWITVSTPNLNPQLILIHQKALVQSGLFNNSWVDSRTEFTYFYGGYLTDNNSNLEGAAFRFSNDVTGKAKEIFESDDGVKYQRLFHILKNNTETLVIAVLNKGSVLFESVRRLPNLSIKLEIRDYKQSLY